MSETTQIAAEAAVSPNACKEVTFTERRGLIFSSKYGLLRSTAATDPNSCTNDALKAFECKKNKM